MTVYVVYIADGHSFDAFSSRKDVKAYVDDLIAKT